MVEFSFSGLELKLTLLKEKCCQIIPKAVWRVMGDADAVVRAEMLEAGVGEVNAEASPLPATAEWNYCLI